MKLQMLLIILPLILSTEAIIVPVDQENDHSDESPIKKADTAQTIPIYYVSSDENVDSYLVPPDPHKPEEIITDIVTPATYLLPPSQNKQVDYYYNPTEPSEQSDWYPIAQNAPKRKPEDISVYQDELEDYVEESPRRAKAQEQRYILPIPSLNLEPPSEDAPNDYLVPTSAEHLQAPVSEEDYDYPIQAPKKLPIVYQSGVEPHLPLHLTAPLPQPYQKSPKKQYPKKYNVEFKPVPIPIAQYADESASEVPRAKPAKLIKPLPSTEIDYLTPTDEKINYLYRKVENKRKLKGEDLRQEHPSEVSVQPAYIKPVPELQTSESYRHPGRNAYPTPVKPVPVKHAPLKAAQDASAVPAPDDRTEFRMHGMKGPHSYQFGYDTGKGKNRQFRYEERDNDGQVKGHYGYMDKHGKLRVVNYSAHPETGFHADAPVEKES